VLRAGRKPINRSDLRTQCMQLFDSVDPGSHDHESSTEAFNVLYKKFLYNFGGPGERTLYGSGTLNGIFSHIVMTKENSDSDWCSDEDTDARMILRIMMKDSSPRRQSQFTRFCKLYCRLKDLLF
jgi:hypothetical protein